MGKVMESIIATRLSFTAEAHNLLPRSHFGGRKGTPPEHALHFIMKRILSAWVARKVATMLLLDVTRAFDNVSHPRLFHNLRKRRIDGFTLTWIASFLSDRYTTLKLVDRSTGKIRTVIGLPQGSPLPILYLFYSPALIEACMSPGNGTVASGFIDNVAILTVGGSAEENLEILREVHGKAIDWANTHGSVFAPAKYELTNFHRFPPPLGPELALRLPGHSLAPGPTCKYLGVVMSCQLTWKAHIKIGVRR